jgi:hypothetical protein
MRAIWTQNPDTSRAALQFARRLLENFRRIGASNRQRRRRKGEECDDQGKNDIDDWQGHKIK